MNNPFSNINWREMSVWRIIVVGAIAIVGLAVVLAILRAAFSQMGVNSISMDRGYSSAPGAPMMDMAMNEMAYDVDVRSTNSKSIMPYPDDGNHSVGGDAEDYEAISYRASIKKSEIESTCDEVEELKPLEYVVFENKDRKDTYCRYQFKVEREYAEEIAEKIEALNPYDFVTNIHTEKNNVTYFEGRLDIMLQQQEMYREMLENVETSYERAIDLSVTSENAEALATLTNDKLRYIKQLSNDRITLAQQLQNLSRSSAEVQDKIEYTSFTVQVNQYKVINLQSLKDSWVREVSQFISSFNNALQYLTIGLLQFILSIFVFLVYAAIVVFTLLMVIKIGIRLGRSTFKKKEEQHYEHHG